MKSSGLDTMSPAMREAKNYYQWIVDMLKPAIGKRILDVGGGQGTLASYFLDREKVFVVDIAEDCVDAITNQLRAHKNAKAILGDITDAKVQDFFVDEKIDTILCTNVLEHIENDAGFLDSFHRILKPTNGQLAILVPAHQLMYGTMDKLAGHYRRYSKSELKEKLLAAGFEIQSIQHMNMVALLGWWLNGKVKKTDSLQEPGMNKQILLYDRYGIPFSRAIEKIFRFPMGLSLVAIASPK